MLFGGFIMRRQICIASFLGREFFILYTHHGTIRQCVALNWLCTQIIYTQVRQLRVSLGTQLNCRQKFAFWQDLRVVCILLLIKTSYLGRL